MKIGFFIRLEWEFYKVSLVSNESSDKPIFLKGGFEISKCFMGREMANLLEQNVRSLEFEYIRRLFSDTKYILFKVQTAPYACAVLCWVAGTV